LISVTEIDKSFGSLKVLNHLTLDFPEKQITTILGPSGCGKTTLLNIMAGLSPVNQGTIQTEAKIGYLFQEPRLLPWLTVRDNLTLVLEGCFNRAELAARADRFLTATGLEEYKEYYPNRLSGGQKQRVALARAFAFPSKLLLMDEPFKSLDLKTRHQLMQIFLQLWRAEPRTVIMVTHDPMEAVYLADRVVVFSDKPVRVIRKQEIAVAREERFGNPLIMENEWMLKKLLLGQIDGQFE
jgi:NitT/TauT family transport system ATP-binding protein